MLTPEENAPIQVGTPGNLTNPFHGATTIDDTQAKDLKDGRWYFNLHSKKFPAGEIRGPVLRDEGVRSDVWVRVTKADYDFVLLSAVVRALEKQKRVRLYYEITADFSGMDPGAMWEDFKVGWGISRAGSGSRSSLMLNGSSRRCDFSAS